MGQRSRTRIAVPVLAGSLLASAALATSCGSAPKPLTPKQLTAQANAVCRRVKAKLEAATKNQSASTPQQIERLTAKISGFEEAALTELTKLVPPPALEADWKRFVSGAQTLAEDTVDLGEYAVQKNTAAAKRLIAGAEATQKQMASVAKRNGWTQCEQVP